MSRISQFAFITLLVINTVGTLKTFATEFVPSALPGQVAEAPIIVRGTIGMTYSDWAAHDDGGRGIFTFYQLQPSEVIKGQVAGGATLLFREIGGEKDGVGEVIPGAAQFTRGEDVVVMLGPQNKDGSYDLRGLSAGKFNIVREEDGSEGLVSVALSPPPHDGKWTLADMKKAVRDQALPQAKASVRPAAAVPASSSETLLSASPPPGDLAASPLQTLDSTSTSARSSWLGIGIFLGALSSALFILVARLKKSRKGTSNV